MSDALLKCYNVDQKTPKWYKKLFYHFVDIAVVNSFILHKEMALEKRRKPLAQRLYGEVLCMQLADCGVEEVEEDDTEEEEATVSAAVVGARGGSLAAGWTATPSQLWTPHSPLPTSRSPRAGCAVTCVRRKRWKTRPLGNVSTIR